MTGDAPLVSIIILNYNHPEMIEACLRTLMITEGVPYEVVVVDNGSEAPVVEFLHAEYAAGRIATLVELPTNLMFLANNVGVAASDRRSEYVLLLNSDVEIVGADWLAKTVGWAEGTTVARPFPYTTKPTVADPGPRDVVSVGWAWDPTVEGHARPDGFCCLIRRSAWHDISPDFPWHYGLEEALCAAARDGAKIGVLCKYQPYIVHHGQGSGPVGDIGATHVRQPDMPAWFAGIRIETLDFTVDPDPAVPYEDCSFMEW